MQSWFDNILFCLTISKLEPGDGKHIKQMHHAFDGVHNANILSVGFHKAPSKVY